MYESTKMSTSNDDVMVVCRLCDKKVEEGKAKYIFDEADLVQKINVLLPIKITQDDESKHICMNCYDNVVSYHNFRQDILKSEKNIDDSNITSLFKLNTNKEITASDILNLDKDMTFKCPNCNICLMILLTSNPDDSNKPFQLSLAVVDQMKSLIRENIALVNKKTVRVISPKKLSAVNKLRSSTSTRDNCTQQIFKTIYRDQIPRQNDNKCEDSPSKKKEDAPLSLPRHKYSIFKRKLSDQDLDKKLPKKAKLLRNEEDSDISLLDSFLYDKSPLDDEVSSNDMDRSTTVDNSARSPETNVGSRKWTCRICSASYFQRLRYEFHMERHTLDKMRDTVCLECDLKTVNELLLFDHYRRTHTVMQYTCMQCDEKYLTKLGLESHQKSNGHSGVKEYVIDPEEAQMPSVLTCTVCGKPVPEDNMNLCNDVATCLNCDTSIASMMVDGYENRFIAQRQFHCAKCNTRFIRKERLEFHMMRHNENKQDVVCSSCGKEFRTENSLYEHYMFVHKGARPFVCELCGKSFQLKTRLREHLRTHTGERPYPCDKCDMRCTTLTALKLHSKIHVSGSSYTCEVCNKSYRKKQNWLDHLEKHWMYDENVALSQWFTCPLCTKTLPTLRMVKRHLKDDHQIDRNDPLITTQQPWYECTECHEKFKHQMTLKAHKERTHEGRTDPIYECDVCKKTFKIKMMLINHIKYKHDGKKRYKCAQCGKRFNDTKRLYNHIAQHIGRKPFACDYCGQTFQRKHARDIHRRTTHTGEQPFHCRLCDKSFFSYSDRAKHRRFVHERRVKDKTPPSTEVQSAPQEDSKQFRKTPDKKH